jgi:hypothetical protein
VMSVRRPPIGQTSVGHRRTCRPWIWTGPIAVRRTGTVCSAFGQRAKRWFCSRLRGSISGNGTAKKHHEEFGAI